MTIEETEHRTLSRDEKNQGLFRKKYLFLNTYGCVKPQMWFNRLILGDNLPVLKDMLLDNSIAGNVKLIYIDPPFATNQIFRIGHKRTATVSSSNNDKLAYSDRLIGDEYLKFLRQRLVILYELLSSDGSIYVHIDYKIGHHVKILMDEVFGEKNFNNDITRIKCNPKNFKRKGYGNIKDMILFYTKNRKFLWNEPKVKMTQEEIIRLFPKIDKHGMRYTTTPLHAPGETRNGKTGKDWRGMKPPNGRHWRVPPEELEILDKKGLIEWSSTGNPRRKIYADEKEIKGKRLQDIWNFKDPQYPTYPTEKNIEMLKLIIETSSDKGDLVLDCFVGSGSTLVAAELCERRWVGIDNSELAIKTSEDRLSSIGITTQFAVLKIED